MSASPMTEDRLLRHVIKQGDGCWWWMGATKGNGYGVASSFGRLAPVHRLSYEVFVGPIPDGLEIDHLCHTNDLTCNVGHACPHRRCVNPDHLEAVTHLENMRRGYWARITHCPKGHAYDATNTAVSRAGRRCRACDRINHAVRRRAMA